MTPLRSEPHLDVAAPGSARPAAGSGVVDFRLDNGLTVVVIPDRRAPVVTHMVWYRNGSADDPRGQVGHRAFPRTSDVQGHQGPSAGRVLAAHRRDRRPGERLHQQRLHRLFPARRQGALERDDGIRGRPHDRPRAHRRDRRARARRGAGRAAHALRRRSERAAQRGGAGRAVHPSPLRHADHRLEPRDRGPRSRGRARLLRAASIRRRTRS